MLKLEKKNDPISYNIYNILYNNINYVKANAHSIKPNYVLKCSKTQLLSKIVESNLITTKDYSVIKEKLGSVNYVNVFLVLPENYGEESDAWDYAVVSSNFENELSITWKH